MCCIHLHTSTFDGKKSRSSPFSPVCHGVATGTGCSLGAAGCGISLLWQRRIRPAVSCAVGLTPQPVGPSAAAWLSALSGCKIHSSSLANATSAGTLHRLAVKSAFVSFTLNVLLFVYAYGWCGNSSMRNGAHSLQHAQSSCVVMCHAVCAGLKVFARSLSHCIRSSGLGQPVEALLLRHYCGKSINQ